MSERSYDIDVGFISKLIETKDITLVKELQIRPSFLTGDSKRVFEYIENTFKETGSIPTERVIKYKFPKYEFDVKDGEVGNEEDLHFWCAELRNRIKHNSLVDTVQEMADCLEKGDSESAYKSMKKSVAFIENEVIETHTVDITKDTEDRKKLYLERKSNKGIVGIETGFKHLDFVTKGLKKGTLTTLIANTGVGKTFFEALIGANCMLNNYTVLQFVTEMSEELMRDRYEAILYAKCYGELSYNQFKSGTLPIEIEKKYFRFLDEDLPSLEPLYLEKATSVSAMEAVIEKYKPDIILIDGVYLMQDDRGADSDWLRVANITRDLKQLAFRLDKPIFINTQADKNTSKKGPNLDSIMYTQAIGQDSDDVWALFRDEVMINEKEMQLRILKQREGVLAKIMLNWDFDVMNFSEIYAEQQQEDNNATQKVEENTFDINSIGE